MILYHGTKQWKLREIFKRGLKPNRIGIIYLSPTQSQAKRWGDGTVIQVDTRKLKLTAFDDCKDWEVLCWTNKPILPYRIKKTVKEAN